MFKSKLLPLHGAFLPNIKYFGTPLVAEKNNYVTKILNVYIICDLDNLPKIPLRNFTLKNCLFGATNILKNSDKSKYAYRIYGTTIDGKGNWNFGNDFAMNVTFFDADNSSSPHADNRNNNF